MLNIVPLSCVQKQKYLSAVLSPYFSVQHKMYDKYYVALSDC